MLTSYVQRVFQLLRNIFGSSYFLEVRWGAKFKRQRPIDSFIIDFFAQEIGLIIEIDGNSHYQKPAYDAMRQSRLESLGYTFLRFTEGEVMQDLQTVGVRIEHAVRCLKVK